jgi:hypothetical protein
VRQVGKMDQLKQDIDKELKADAKDSADHTANIDELIECRLRDLSEQVAANTGIIRDNRLSTLHKIFIGIAWVISLAVAGSLVTFSWEHVDVSKMGVYIPAKVITGLVNISLLYTAIFLFQFSFGNPLQEIFHLKGASWQEKLVAGAIIISVIAMTGYLISIGA